MCIRDRVSNARQTEYLARQGADQRELGAATEIEVDISEVTASDVSFNFLLRLGCLNLRSAFASI